MAGVIPIGSNTIGYDSLNLSYTTNNNEPNLLTRSLQFRVFNSTYLSVAGGSTATISSTTDGVSPGPKLYLRNMSFNSGSTAGDVLIYTDALGNGLKTFTVNKIDVPLTGETGPYALLFSPNLDSYSTGTDHTNPIFITFPLATLQAGSVFSVDSQKLTKTEKNAAVLELNNVRYDGMFLSSGQGSVSAYVSNSNVGLSGTTSDVTGIFVGNSYNFDSNGNTRIDISHESVFDTTIPNNYYMIYNFNGNDGASAGTSYNYLGVTGVNLPFTSNVEFNTSSIGVTASFYNLNYDFEGLTAGQSLKIFDIQKGASGTTATLPINLAPNGIPYASYLFSPVGGTSVVLSGSRLYYYDGVKTSNNHYSIPQHISTKEGITGFINVNPSIFINTKVTGRLENFDYTDKDGNSIFNRFDGTGVSGKLYLTGSDQLPATKYSGPNGKPFMGATAGIEVLKEKNFNIEFPTGLTNGPEIKYYDAFFYDYTTSSLKGATAKISYNWPGRLISDENIIANKIVSVGTSNSLYLKISEFDYLDKYGDSVLQNGETGILTITDVSKLPYSEVGTINYTGPYDPRGISGIFYEKTFSNVSFKEAETKIFTLSFTDKELRPSNKVFTVKESPEVFSCGFGNIIRNPSFTVIDFNYFDSLGNSIMYGLSGSSGSTGFIQLFDPDGRMMQSVPTILDINAKYDFDIPLPPGASGFSPFVGYYLQYFESNSNSLRRGKRFIDSETRGIGNTGVSGGTASDWQGSNRTLGVPANFIFPYEFNASAAEVLQVILLGELTFGPSGGVLQTINMKVPTTELQRMFVYNTAWSNGMSGVGGGVSGASGSGEYTQGISGNTGLTGPDIGLMLQYVLANVNVSSGFTGSGGRGNISNRLQGLDTLFSTNLPSWPQNGLGGLGDPWNTLSIGGPTGGPSTIQGYPSSQNSGYFLDDVGVTLAQMGLIMKQGPGSSGTIFSYPPGSLLNQIPIEAVRSLDILGAQVQPFAGPNGIFKDIDTTMPLYQAPLQNLFEQAVAFQRVTDTMTEPVSSLSGLASVTGPWLSNSPIYSVNFNDGDTLSLFIQYQFGQARQYGIDPTVVAGLGPRFTSAPVYQLTFAGKTFNIPIGRRDTNTSLYTNGYNMDTFSQNEVSLNSSTTQTIELRLIASPQNVKSVFDY